LRLSRLGSVKGHQNQRPSSVAIDGVTNDRMMKVSSNNPRPMVVPTWPIDRRSLVIIDIMVKANTSPAEVTTPPVLARARMSPVFIPAGLEGEVCGYTGEAFAVFCRTSTATEVGATI
jgi:hypothetical protein